ncbi:MAG TPA: hypothetical protein VMY80_14045 [Anaerolineae bacterium]|nr:hypothetical protein [Anaerolineae bacterium]
MEQSKRCSACGRDLPATTFYRDGRNRDGLYSECKPCIRERRKADSAKRRAADNARRARDPQTARARDAEYYQEHKAERNEAQRRYRAKRRKR